MLKSKDSKKIIEKFFFKYYFLSNFYLFSFFSTFFFFFKIYFGNKKNREKVILEEENIQIIHDELIFSNENNDIDQIISGLLMSENSNIVKNKNGNFIFTFSTFYWNKNEEENFINLLLKFDEFDLLKKFCFIDNINYSFYTNDNSSDFMKEIFKEWYTEIIKLEDNREFHSKDIPKEFIITDISFSFWFYIQWITKDKFYKKFSKNEDYSVINGNFSKDENYYTIICNEDCNYSYNFSFKIFKYLEKFGFYPVFVSKKKYNFYILINRNEFEELEKFTKRKVDYCLHNCLYRNKNSENILKKYLIILQKENQSKKKENLLTFEINV